MRTSSEYEIFVNLEAKNGPPQMPKLVRSLKRQLSYVKIEDDRFDLKRLNSMSSIASDEEKQHEEEIIDELLDSTCLINTDGVMVRKSKFPFHWFFP